MTILIILLFNSFSTSLSASMDELPPPPQPDDLAMLQSQNPHGVHSQINNSTNHGHSSNNSHINKIPSGAHYNNNSNGTSSNPASQSNNYKLNSSSHYHSHYSSNNSNSTNNRSNTPTNRSRDPSPVGSDFSDSDLPNNGLLSRGVRRNGSDASFKAII